jgi:flagellar motor switch protein FliN
MSLTLTTLSLADYQQAWSRSAAELLSQIAAARFTSELQVLQSATPSAELPALCGCFSVKGSCQGETALFVTSEDALTLSQLFLGEPVERVSELKAENRKAFAELLGQLGGNVASSLRSAGGEEAHVSLMGLASPSWLPEASAGFDLCLSGPGVPALTLHLIVSPDLGATLGAEPSAAGEVRGRASTLTVRQPNLEFLKDVEVGVSLRFGTTSLRLREVLEIMPGAVFELDQQVSEPVELLVGKKVVARGEVVIVDDCYAVRITDVISPTERADSLCD